MSKMVEVETSTFEARSLFKDSFKILRQLYEDEELCDTMLKVGEKAIHCHRVVLAACSPYFFSMFTSGMGECYQDTVTIKDIDSYALEQIVRFAYTSKVVMTTENVQSLLYAACLLQVEVLAKACCDFMKAHLHPANCLGIRMFAEQHNRMELMKCADKHSCDNFLDVIQHDEFLQVSAGHLTAMISSSDLNIDAEEQVYEAVMKWVKHDITERKQHVSDIFRHVRFPMLQPSFLMSAVEQEEMLRKDHSCRDLIDEAKNYHLSKASKVPGLKYSIRTQPRKSCAGVLFSVGGRGASGDPFKSIEAYDLRNDRWFQIPEMSTRRRHVGVTSTLGKLYAMGGHDGSDHLNTVEMYDPHINKWTILSPMATKRRGIAVASLGGPIYAVGGLDDSACFHTVERYDIESDTWNFVAPMNTPRGGVGVAPLQGYLYAIGGNDGVASLNSCERYDPHLNKWVEISPMIKRRAGAGLAVLNGFLYAVGGFDDNAPLDSVERFDPTKNEWEMVGGMSCCRGGVGVAALGGKVYAVGGHDGGSYLNSVEAYDPILDKWAEVNSIGICRAGAGVATCDCTVTRLKDIGQISVVSCV
ncbi:kelch-like protein 8 isoform X2 [Branchiostoma lanceolatum]|uniref:KLHL8 protein n=3 Tax=Branchiostoma lanceolatum TaxID=7740 RepID=A0A8K0EZU8_BRALA|nr:KLHL8 [Branchiostoma lanceolatum]